MSGGGTDSLAMDGVPRFSPVSSKSIVYLALVGKRMKACCTLTILPAGIYTVMLPGAVAEPAAAMQY